MDVVGPTEFKIMDAGRRVKVFDPDEGIVNDADVAGVRLNRAWASWAALGGSVLCVAANADSAARAEAVVTRTVENMYSAPTLEKDVVSQAFLGQTVGILETRGAFVKVETPDRYQGWIPAGALTRYPSAATPRYAFKGTVAEVRSLWANVYREADVTTARPRSKAPLGARLEVVKGPLQDRWYEVRLPNGEAGFVQQGDILVHDAASPLPAGAAADLVATGRRLLGVPYLWGGMTPLGLDCSGFVSLVYRVHGRVLPRDADLQFRDPRADVVARADLLAGDLLFFGRAPDKITHVGMYLGAGRFLNATTHETPVVREDLLDDVHWAALYQGARRPR
jgi:cell wall-associated NlpC family hydrolase